LTGCNPTRRRTAGRCPPGCRRVVYERWIADPDSPARDDPDEICTIRDGQIYRRGRGPRPPAHYGCKCKREYAYHRCVPRNPTQ